MFLRFGFIAVVFLLVVSALEAQNVNEGCAVRVWTKEDVIPPDTFPEVTWLSLPSIVKIGEGNYQALGRAFYVDTLKEQLRTQTRLHFDDKRRTMDLVEQLDVLVDTLYVQGVTELFGIKNVNIYARSIVAKTDSKLILSAPDWIQEFKNVITPGTAYTPGSDGESGKDGVNGPQVQIFCNSVSGNLIVTSNGGDGHKGQDGGRGASGVNGVEGRSRGKWDCTHFSCYSKPGDSGGKGTDGTNGGNAGTPGRGGRAGNINLRYRKISGEVKLMSCKGLGAEPAVNGQGGRGGAGGRGGQGVSCRSKTIYGRPIGVSSYCTFRGMTGRAATGSPGRNGSPGSTPSVKGQDGEVDDSFVGSEILDASDKESFSKELLLTMKRKAEDLLLGNSADPNGRDALEFIRHLTEGRSDARQINEDVKRKLRFVENGHDIFGKNKLFFPRKTWEDLIAAVEDYKVVAQSYETAFNDIIASMVDTENLQQLTTTVGKMVSTNLEGERKRLVEDKRVATSEKGARLTAIKALEVRMDDITNYIQRELTNVYQKAQFHPGDIMAILQGVVGFFSGVASKDPLSALGSILGIVESTSGKKCLRLLEDYSRNIKDGLNFGKAYKVRVDASDLDFDKIDISSLPEIMQMDLDMKKEKLTAELVCLLGIASREQDVAHFKAEIESFFAAGAARITLIARLLELDNQIGGDMYDIQVLEDTKTKITDLSNSPDPAGTEILRKTFTDELLSAYSELEETFLRKLHYLVKAFEFLTLWEANNPLSSFRRQATDSAYGTGRLNGDLQLTQVLQKVKTYFLDRGANCFLNVRHTRPVWKYSFDNINNKAMFDKLVSEGSTTFSIDIDQSCETCYNARILKIHIELFGPEEQPTTLPDYVNIQFRHRSSSYFRAGDNSIKHYRQIENEYKNGSFVDAYERIIFNRHGTSDAKKCRENGGTGIYCGVKQKDDNRLKALCDDPVLRSRPEGTRLYLTRECKSPFGVYDLKIPVDRNLECSDTSNKETNCKDLDLTKFTKMNVFAVVLYWNDRYPTGANDPMCKTRSKKKDKAAVNQQ